MVNVLCSTVRCVIDCFSIRCSSDLVSTNDPSSATLMDELDVMFLSRSPKLLSEKVEKLLVLMLDAPE